MDALIFAAGLGTRLKPLTDNTPKALVEIGDKTLLQIQIERLIDAGFDHIVVNVHHFADQIVNFLKENNNFGIDIAISDERDLLLETGGGVRHALEQGLIGRDDRSPFLVHNVDIISNLDLKWFYEQHMNKMTELSVSLLASLLVSQRDTNRYLLFDDNDYLVGWTNIKTGEVKSPYGKIDPKQYKMRAFAGIHILSPEVKNIMNSKPTPVISTSTSSGSSTEILPSVWSGKFSIIDFYLSVASQYKIRAIEYPDLKITDVGTPESLQQAAQEII